MKTSLIIALLAGTMLAAPALAQNTSTNTNGAASNSTGTGVGTAVNGPINNNSNTTSGANSNSTGTGVGIATVAPISNNSNTTSGALSNSGAVSNSRATGGTGGTAISNATGGTATTGAANAANNQNLNVDVSSNTVIPANTTSRFAPQVVASGLTTSNDTCMGSTSAGLSLIGGGGTVGTTWDDKACNRRQNAARMYAMGWRQESCEIMMDDPTVKAAFARTNRKCEDIAENDQPPVNPPPALQPLAAPEVPPPPAAPAQAVPQPPPGERGQNGPPPAQQLQQTSSLDSLFGDAQDMQLR